MNIDRNTLTAVFVCTLFFVGYQHYLDVKYPDRFKTELTEPENPTPPGDETTLTSASAASSEATLVGTAPIKTATEDATIGMVALKPDELMIENDDVLYLFNQKTAGIDQITLKKYEDDLRQGPMLLLDRSLFIQASPVVEKTLTEQNFAAERDGKSITFSRKIGTWLVKQRYEIAQTGYGLNLRFSWQNIDEKSQELVARFGIQEEQTLAPEHSSFLGGLSGVAHKPSVLVGTSQETKWRDIKEFCQDGQEISGKNSDMWFLGFDSQYFMEVLIPDFKNADFRIERLAGVGNACSIKESVSLDHGLIKPQDQVAMELRGWFGPKSSDMISGYDNKLKEALDLGFFSKIAHLLFIALSFVNTWLGNWGLAIIAVTIFLKILFYPLNRHAAFAQRDMKKLQPEIQRLKEKYKDDQALQQRETMRFMSEHKINPLKGCLPILLQIPVFIAFYRLLSTSVELRHASFYGWIHDLAAADPYYIMPLLLGAGQVLQQKLTPMSGMDKATERIMMMMPIFFTIMTLTLPAGMVLYLLANTVTSIMQQQWLNKRVINA